MTTQSNSKGEFKIPYIQSPNSGPSSGSSTDDGGSSGHIIFSLGWNGIAQAALNDMIEKYVQLDQNQDKINIKVISDQYGDGKNGHNYGVIQAEADSIINAANQEMTKAIYDCSNEAVQGGSSLATAYYSGPNSTQRGELATAGQELSDAQGFEDEFSKTTAASRSVSNKPQLQQMTQAEQQRYSDIVNGKGPVKYDAQTDKNVLDHIASNAQDSAKVSARINQAKSDAITKQNKTMTDVQNNAQRKSAYIQMAQHGVSAGISFEKGRADLAEGQANATKVTADASAQNLKSVFDTGQSLANEEKKQAEALQQIRQALAAHTASAAG